MGSVNSKIKSSSLFGYTGSFLEYNRIIDHINIGDLIEIQRSSYKHWVLCERIDDNGIVWCFHVNGADLQLNGDRRVPEVGCIKYEPLLDILNDNSSSRPSLCRINNQEKMAEEALRKALKEKPDIDSVFEMLHNLKDTLVKYDLKSSNCEHYCTLWKYGIGWSSQVNKFQDIVTAILKIVSSFTGTTGKALMRNGFYKVGGVCLIISSIAAKFVENIDFFLKDLRIEYLAQHAIAY